MNDQNNANLAKPKSRFPRPSLLLLLVLVSGMAIGMIYDRLVSFSFVPVDASGDFRLMAEAWNTIQHYYVDRSALQPKKLTYGAISGMVNALGDTGHSVFLTPGQVHQLSVTESGQLKGIGVEIHMRKGHVVIVAPLDNSPAQRAGLRSGDIIMSVDGKDITGWSLDQVVAKVTGPVGTSVKLTLLTPESHKVRKVTLIRATITLKNVTWDQLPGTDLVDLRIARFSDDVAGSLRQALRQIIKPSVHGIVLDLRNNPGGVLTEAIKVASEFLSHGNVLLVRNAHGKVTPKPVLPGGLATHIPLVVLVNGGSASAAEIVAGALKDAHRAKLIGETTFGTGTVLNEFPLPDGSALLLAVQEWLTPSGHSFWHKGIKPGIVVPLPDGIFPLVPAAERTMSPAQLKSSKDAQLLRAIKLLNGEISRKKTNPGTTTNSLSATKAAAK